MKRLTGLIVLAVIVATALSMAECHLPPGRAEPPHLTLDANTRIIVWGTL